MNYDDNPVFQNIFERRSIRKYTDEAVSKEDITAILEAGRWAPSGLNNQPWRFLVINKDDPRHDELANCTKYSHIVRASHTCICVMLDKTNMYSPIKDHQGAGACVQNMLLAIHALGLGAVWLGEIINDQPKTLGALGLNDDTYEIQAVLAVGHPDQKGSSKRKPLSELLLEEI